MAPVAEHMTRTLLTIAPEATVREAAARMVERGVGAVVVLDGEALLAIFTERDVLRAVAAGAPGEARVAEWMTRHPDTIEPTDTTEHAASLMIHGGYRHLPVVEERRLVGIVSIRDLMRVALADSAPRGV
ncbi:MAG TPA: CBS domain-containing protein [Gaiellaceae bacterium]|nr:CBS domain-containing protein [Gaiellaceae bacterium]